jgi:hypothetical protein
VSLATLVHRLNRALPGAHLWGRTAWCRKQRKRLGASERDVVWVRDSGKLPWAVWGAENGFFDVEWAGPLPYLRALRAAA